MPTITGTRTTLANRGDSPVRVTNHGPAALQLVGAASQVLAPGRTSGPIALTTTSLAAAALGASCDVDVIPVTQTQPPTPLSERIRAVETGGAPGGGAVSSVVGRTGAVTGEHIVADPAVGSALAARAPLASPDLTGVPTAPTAAPGTSTNQVATTQFVSGGFLGADANGRVAVSRSSLNQFGGAVPVTTANNLPQKATLFGGVTVMTTRNLHKTTVEATDFVLMAPSWWAGGVPFATPRGLANNYTVKAAIEYGGIAYPVTWNGVRSVTVEPFGSVVSDPVGVNIPAGAEFYVRAVFTTPTVDGEIPINVNTQGAFGTSRPTSGGAQGGYTAGADAVDAVGPLASSDNFPRAGLVVLGRPLGPRSPVIVGIGDSIMRGQTDSINDGGGFLIRGVGPLVATVNTGVPSMPASLLAGPGAGAVNLRKLWSLGTHALIAQGTNDLFNGRTVAQLQADLITLANRCVGRGLRATVGTIMPRSTSTDSWATLANQTTDATTNANRVTVNNWLRAGAPVAVGTLAPVAVGTPGALLATVFDASGAVVVNPSGAGHPISSVIELADTIESARDSGLFKVTGSPNGYTSDGIHPNTNGYSTMAGPVTLWASSLTA